MLPLPAVTYFINLLCSQFTCQAPYPYPEIVREFGKSDTWIFSDSPPIFETKYGKVEGYYLTTSNGRQISAFEGIPYGVAERWKPAVPVEEWGDVRQAKKPGPDCLQFNVRKLLKIYGEEDCLFLNVYTPKMPGYREKSNLPVVIYIHGGSFLFGSGSDHGPAYLLNEDIVLVTIHYRLGVLGFLSTGDNVVPGNLGMKDQVLAIKWVKDNILNFGGNPENITLWGYSAGGVSVHLHLMSNQSKHLFTKGISHGGTAFSEWGVHAPWRAREYTEQLASYFKCPTKNSNKMVTCLKKLSAVSVVAAQIHLVPWMPFPPSIFVPTIEPLGTIDPFLDITPEEAYKNGVVSPKPWIVTTTKDEGLSAIVALELTYRWTQTKLLWMDVAKHCLDLDYLGYGERKLDKLVRNITKFYLGNKPPLLGSVFEFSDIMTDRYFHFAVTKSIQAHSQIAPTYSYLFSYHDGNYNLGNLFQHSSNEWGAGHGEDENFMFNSTYLFQGFKQADPEFKLSRILINLFTNYVTNGTPTYTATGEELDIWEPINPFHIRLLHITGKELRMISPNFGRVQFWADLKLPDASLLLPLSS